MEVKIPAEIWPTPVLSCHLLENERVILNELYNITLKPGLLSVSILYCFGFL